MDSMCLDELMGSLKIYKLNIAYAKTEKEINLRMEKCSHKNECYNAYEEEIGLITKKLKNLIKRGRI